MPVKEYPGEIGWGYTPRYHFAIQRSYGTTAEMKEMIDTFHKHGIRVIIDGVYNHVSNECLPMKSLENRVQTREEKQMILFGLRRTKSNLFSII